MAKFIHFAPVNLVNKIRCNGLRKSTEKHRALGVYAIPCVGLQRATTKMWLRHLRSKGAATAKAAIIFEIDDQEPVHMFRDWIDNAGVWLASAVDSWENGADWPDHGVEYPDLVPARTAEVVFREILNRNTRLDLLIAAVGPSEAAEQIPGGHDVPEVVVPRSISASEIVSITLPGKPNDRKGLRRRRKMEDEKLFLTILEEMAQSLEES